MVYASSLNARPLGRHLNLSKFKEIIFYTEQQPTPFPLTTARHLQQHSEFKLLTISTIRLTNEMQALSRQSKSQKRVWSGWKEIMASSH